MRLASARRTKTEDATDDDIPSTSGRQFTEATSAVSVPKVVLVQDLPSFRSNVP